MNNIAIGVLAFNEEKHISTVLDNLVELDLPIYIINDASTDNTKKIIESYAKNYKIRNINNPINLGAGHSTLKLLETVRQEGFEFLVKIDGDNQFKTDDIKKIINIYKKSKFDFIKSNRFWENGIEGSIPLKRYFGNLLATIFFQFASGTNKLFDPLNGLFGVNVKILDLINFKKFPKRYGYPFYISVLSVISFLKTYQINNTVVYKDQNSYLSSLRVLKIIISLTFHFYILKIKTKIKFGKFQRSAFIDIVFLFMLLITFIFLIRTLLIFSSISYFSTSNLLLWLLLLLILFIATSFIFIESFKEERDIRDSYIENEE